MDYKIFHWIIWLASFLPSLNKPMIWISNKARYVFIFALVIMWFSGQSYKKVTVNATISVLFSLLINAVIKVFYFKPRPFVYHRVGILTPSKRDSSFPSKHTILAFAVSTSIFLHDRFIGSIMWVLAFLTGFSRIWIGHHYPLDIIGSAMIGSFTSIFTDKTSHLLKPSEVD